MRLVPVLICLLALLPGPAGSGPAGADSGTEPTSTDAAALFKLDGPAEIARQTGPVPGWQVTADGRVAGFIASTWEVAGSLGYSGRPIDILVAVTPDRRLAGARLVRHEEPILTLGLSTGDIAAFVDRFAGLDLTQPLVSSFGTGGPLPDVISGATVSSGVIRDAILRTARTVAQAGAGGGIDRVAYEPRDWAQLTADGAVTGAFVSLEQARTALARAKVPVPTGDAAFLDLWVTIIDPPTIGRNLLGQQAYSAAMASAAEGGTLMVASRGLHSHRGTAWRRSGIFDRVTIRQGGKTVHPRADTYSRIDALQVPGAPDFKEISLFRLPPDLDPTQPMRVEITATRKTDTGDVSTTIPVDYTLPQTFLAAPSELPDPEPLWISAWQSKQGAIAGVGLMLLALAAILFLQEAFVRRPRLWRWGRIAFLSFTLIWLGWIAGGQLSVVQVVAFLQSLLSGFRWETFLIEPVIFLLWGFVALGLLFWGRGVYCGWLCPFGALQELTNNIAQRLGVPQITLPYGLHERLWVIKYTLFLAILALSFYSMEKALILAEAEPFKTAMSMHFLRAWPFVAFVAALLVAGLFIERFYCRYLCPLGAALAIPAKLKLFDWLRRRPQCGRECRLCEQKCTVGAIDPIGRINPNECVLCLRCQMIFYDDQTCTILKGRKARAERTAARS